MVADRRATAIAVTAAGLAAALLPAAAATARPGAPAPPGFTFAGTAAPGAIAIDALLAHAPTTWRQLVGDAVPNAAVTHVPNRKVRVVLATGEQAAMRALLARTVPVPAAAQVIPFAGSFALVRTERIEQYVASVIGAVPAGAPAAVADVIAVATRSHAASQAARGYVVPCAAGQCVSVGLPSTASAIGRAARATRGLVLTAHGAVVAATLVPSHGWKRVLAPTEVAAKLGYPGTLQQVTISSVNAQGRPDLLTLSGSAGDRVTDARTLARTLGLPAAPDHITAPVAAVGSELSDAAELAATAIDAPPIQPAELPAHEPAPLTEAAVPAPVVAPALPVEAPQVAAPETVPVALPPSVLADLLGGLLAGNPQAAEPTGLDLLGALAETSPSRGADPAATLDLLVPAALEPATITGL